MNGKVHILWVNDHPEVAKNMLFMYAINAKKNQWFDEVEIIIWGPSAKLVANNEMIQELIKEALQFEIEVKACIACANQYEVTNDLKRLGIEVYPMGIPLTQILKSKESIITI